MKHIHVVMAKIRPEIYELIERGEKRWEVRDEEFVSYSDWLPNLAIQYTDLSGAPLGLWRLDSYTLVDSYCELDGDGDLNDNAYIMLRRSGVSEKTFRQLFDLVAGTNLYRARIVRKLDSLADVKEES